MSNPVSQSERPSRSGLILLALIVGAIVANINLSVANVALPTIGSELNASQDQLNAIAEAFALGLASTVLYLGAIGDRYGRKMLFVIGAILTVPTAMLSAWAPNAELLAGARLLSGFAAALLFPTTLSLISSLYRGNARVKAIALWSGLGAGFAALGPLMGGWLLEYFWWGSVFLISVPLALFALIIGIAVIPNHISSGTEPVDHLGGVLSVLGVGGLVVIIQTFHSGVDSAWLITATVAVLAIIGFFFQQKRATRPLVDLPLAKARTFWVAFVGGAITFGALIGAMFIGQQFVQDVLGYSTFSAAAVAVPSAIFAAVGGQVAGKVVIKRGSRDTLSIGLGLVVLAFIVMLFSWKDGTNIFWILLAYALVGAGVGMAATPASRALMSSVPESHAGMGSAFLDLTRDFGGAVLQALLGGVLAGAYVSRMQSDIAGLPAAQASQVTTEISDSLTASFGDAAHVAAQYPGNIGDQILKAAAQAFTDGKSAAMTVALVLSILGLLLVVFLFPKRVEEEAYYTKIAATK
jgi:DHA2 family multidrug resistance protein-like MFS transporter